MGVMNRIAEIPEDLLECVQAVDKEYVELLLRSAHREIGI